MRPRWCTLKADQVRNNIADTPRNHRQRSPLALAQDTQQRLDEGIEMRNQTERASAPTARPQLRRHARGTLPACAHGHRRHCTRTRHPLDDRRRTRKAAGEEAGERVRDSDSTRLGGQLHPSKRSECEPTAGRSPQPVRKVNSTRLGGQLNSSGRSTQPVWEIDSTRLGGRHPPERRQLHPSTPPRTTIGAPDASTTPRV